MRTVESTSVERWWSINPPMTSSPDARSAARLDAVLDALSVETNPRYRPSGRTTFCNIFVHDVTRCMGVEIPHWVDGAGVPAGPDRGGVEMNANAMHTWMTTRAARASGWRPMGPRTAQESANAGKPTVVTWQSQPGGIGHVAVVTPSQWDAQRGVIICQSGAVNFRRASVSRGFGARDVNFWGAP